MSTPEEFEVALVKAQAAIAGLRAEPTAAVPGRTASAAGKQEGGSAGAPAGATSVAMAAPVQLPAAATAAEPSHTLARYRRPALVLVCIAVAFLQYYYIDVSLKIASLPAVFTPR